MINALVLAGASSEGELERLEKVSHKALITINRHPMIAYILWAIKEVPAINSIWVVGSEGRFYHLREEKRQLPSFTLIEEKGSLLENLEAGLKEVPAGEPCLVITSDIPLIDADAIQDFLYRCNSMDKDFYYPILNQKDCESAYPGMKRTYLKIKEGVYTGGNMALVNPTCILNHMDRLHMVFSYRKKPWKYARILSPSLVIKLALRTITIAELENHIYRTLSINVGAVKTPRVEIGVDVDKPSDLELVRSILE